MIVDCNCCITSSILYDSSEKSYKIFYLIHSNIYLFTFYILLFFFNLVPFYDDEISNNLDEGRRRQNKGADFTFDNQRHYDGESLNFSCSYSLSFLLSILLLSFLSLFSSFPFFLFRSFFFSFSCFPFFPSIFLSISAFLNIFFFFFVSFFSSW